MAAKFAIDDYLQALIPDLATLLPGYNTAVAINAAMALYWSYIFKNECDKDSPGNPENPNYLDESVLSERQKSMTATRVAITLLAVVNKWLTAPQVLEAGAGPALVKFQDLSKLLRSCLPLWQTDLNNAEAAEGIFFNLLPNVPAFLMKMEENYPVLGRPLPGATIFESVTPVIQSQSYFQRGRYFPSVPGEPRRVEGPLFGDD